MPGRGGDKHENIIRIFRLRVIAVVTGGALKTLLDQRRIGLNSKESAESFARFGNGIVNKVARVKNQADTSGRSVCGCSLAGIAGSNPTSGMNVYLL